MKKEFILLILCFLAFVAPSFACDCDGEVPLKESLAKSPKVFLGKVISIKGYKTLVKPKYDWQQYYVIEFKPKEVYKGKKSDTIMLIAESSDCGGEFMEGSSYLVFTFWNEKEKKLEYHQCFRMALPEQYAAKDIAKIKSKN